MFLKGHMRDHMKTHGINEKPFGCNECGAKFNQNSQLKVHMRVSSNQSFDSGLKSEKSAIYLE